MRKLVSLFIPIALTALITACGGGQKNPTVRSEVKNKLRDHIKVGVEEYKRGNYESSRMFLEEALNEAYSIDNIDETINVLLNLGELEFAQDNLVSASNYVFLAKTIAEQEKIAKYNFQLFMNLGKYYNRTGNNELIIRSYNQAIASTSKQEERAIVYNNLGNIFSSDRLKQFPAALKYLDKARRINESKKIYDQLANNYYNIGEVYFKQMNWKAALRNYELALKYDKISEKTRGIMSDLVKIAMVNREMSDTSEALLFLARALRVAKSTKNASRQKEIQALIDEYSGKTKVETPPPAKPNPPKIGTETPAGTGTTPKTGEGTVKTATGTTNK